MPDTRAKLELVLAVRALRRRASSALDVGGSYASFSIVAAGRAACTWCRRRAARRLEPHTWWFPIVGAVPYKGYFDAADARGRGDAARGARATTPTCGRRSRSARSAGSTIRCCRRWLRADPVRIAETPDPRAAPPHALRPGRDGVQRVAGDLRRPRRRDRVLPRARRPRGGDHAARRAGVAGGAARVAAVGDRRDRAEGRSTPTSARERAVARRDPRRPRGDLRTAAAETGRARPRPPRRRQQPPTPAAGPHAGRRSDAPGRRHPAPR